MPLESVSRKNITVEVHGKGAAHFMAAENRRQEGGLRLRVYPRAHSQ